MEVPDFTPTDFNPDVHLLISRSGNSTFLCPTRKVSRLYAMGLLQDALTALSNSSSNTIDPAYSPLNVFVTIAQVQGKTDWDGYDWDESDDDDEGTPVESR